MSGEDKALAFFGSCKDSLDAFNSLKLYMDDSCPGTRISVQDSLLAFKTSAGYAYVSLPPKDSDALFSLAITTRKKLSSERITKSVQPIPGVASFVYHIIIRSIDDIDNELKSWIRQSYEYSKVRYA